MVKLLKKDRRKYYIIFALLSIFGNLLLFGDESDLIATLTSSNYVFLILNNVYILYMYQKTKKIKSIYNNIICRIGSKKFLGQYIMNAIIDIIAYNIIIQLIIYLKLGIYMPAIDFFILISILRFACFLIQELVSMLVFMTKNGTKYMIIPIVINLFFNYYIINWLLIRFTNYI